MQCKYRVILSIDGGGIKGLVPLRILSFLQQEIRRMDEQVRLAELVDVFSGSSTGSIIGGALMIRDEFGNVKFSPSDMLELYLRRGKQIFSKNVGVDPSHSIYPLSFVLDHFFGDITVEKIHKRFLFVSYDLKSDSTYLFTDTADRFRDLPLSKMMIACSAYPGVFPPLQLGNLLLADGMVAAKNPTELAYNYAKMFYPDDPIIVLSLGTGKCAEGKMDLIDSEMELVHQNMEALRQEDKRLIYFRLQPTLRKYVSQDADITDLNIHDLIEDSDRYLDSQRAELRRLLSLIKIKVEQIA